MEIDSPLRWIRRQVFQTGQEEIALIGGVSRSRVSRYESGASDLPFRFMRRIRNEALARGLNFSADWFFGPPEAEAASASEPPPEAEGDRP